MTRLMYMHSHLTISKLPSRKQVFGFVNSDVVTGEMLVPSKKTSCKAHLPFPPDNPAVNVLVTMLQKLTTINESDTGDKD